VTRDAERDYAIRRAPRCGRTDSSGDTTKSCQSLEERCEDLKLLRCLIRPSRMHEKHRSFLFSNLDLLKRTDPDETVRNVEYMM
jgi:hypothetical protein